jgi:glutathione synthase/RimK-type ligase-like ATP-grasp enzyme
MPKTIRVLVVDSDNHSWIEFFSKREGDGYIFVVEQGEWNQFSIESYPDSSGTMVYITPNKRPIKDTKQNQHRLFEPDIVIIRKLVQGLKKGDDWRNILCGFAFGNIPCINSVQSIMLCQERAFVIGAMKEIASRDKDFPMIAMTLFTEPNQMLFTPQYPLVAKVASYEAGFGKMKISNQGDLKDLGSILTCYGDYVTLETYIKDKDYDIRIQKIGSHYRAYKRVSMVGNWKSNQGSSKVESIKMTDQFKKWIDSCSKLFGGMDILTVDAVHTKDDKYYILEINDTASGFLEENQLEDMGHVYEVLLEKLKKL